MFQYSRLFSSIFLIIIFLTSCANIGSPDGGRYDEEPPVVLGAIPADKSRNVKTKNINIAFNEYIKITNVSEKVVVSPPQLELANIRAQGKKIKITLYDSLQSNTTYTIDFSDAIEDNNEGNPMGFYTYSFSTGSEIDTMEMSGHVLAAENLEPIKGMLVGLHKADSTFNDTLFRTKALTRVSRTNSQGQFTIKGIAPGKYRVFALQDTDGDYCFSQRSEAIAFDTTIYIPSSKPDLRMDTCWRDTIYYDSIRVVPYTHYYPDNIVLRSFLESKQDLHMLKTERPEPDWFRLYFTAHVDTLPLIKGLNFNDSCLVLEATQYNDTLTYWITDTSFTHHTDSLMMEIKYLNTDSLERLSWRTDTLTLVARKGWAKIQAERQKLIDEWEKEREKRVKKSKTPLPAEKNPHEIKHLSIKVTPTGTLDLNKNIIIEMEQPISNIDTTLIHLYLQKDSNLISEPYILSPTPYNAKSYTLFAEWEPNQKYTLSIDSAAITGIMGESNNKQKSDIRVKSLEEYGTLIVNLISPDTCMVVQLLNSSDKVVNTANASNTGVAEFYFLKPDKYFMRCFADRNGNGIWDAGIYDTQQAPEPVYYFPQPMNVRASWDVEQAWDVLGIPVLQQKPAALIKQKADKKKTPKERNKEREKEKQNRK